MQQRAFIPFRMRRNETDTSPVLQRAHELMTAGDYAGAAVAFEKLAQSAEENNGQRAPFLFLQAARARILQGQTLAGMAHFKHGIQLLSQTGRYNQVYRVGQRIIQELRMRGLDKEAREIAALVGSNTPAIADMPTERGPDMSTIILPTHCTSCGGPIRASEVEWTDARTAECAYCGSPVRLG